jgi:uncharacterized protein
VNFSRNRRALADIYDRFENETRELRRDAVCRPGCAFCCTEMGTVDLTTLEAVAIRER